MKKPYKIGQILTRKRLANIKADCQIEFESRFIPKEGLRRKIYEFIMSWDWVVRYGKNYKKKFNTT